LTGLYFWKNIKNIINSENIEEDTSHPYRYRAMHKKDFEDPDFEDENEKLYFNNLKIFFLNNLSYNVFVDDNYISYLHYNNFINNLKSKIFKKKYNMKYKEKVDLKIAINGLDLNTNLLKVKEDILNNSFFKN